jgi:hypothetical protein
VPEISPVEEGDEEEEVDRRRPDSHQRKNTPPVWPRPSEPSHSRPVSRPAAGGVEPDETDIEIIPLPPPRASEESEMEAVPLSQSHSLAEEVPVKQREDASTSEMFAPDGIVELPSHQVTTLTLFRSSTIIIL